MFEAFAATINLPEWATWDSRYGEQYINELWLRNKFYSHIKYGFWQEAGDSGQLNRMYEKRPSIQLNLPMLATDVSSRMLFAPSRAARFQNEKGEIEDKLKKLAKKIKILSKMLEVSFWGQGGSCAVTIKVIDSIPCLNVWQGRHCWPTFDEAEQLSEMMLAYPVMGAAFAKQDPPINTDFRGNPLDPEADYWYIRIFNKKEIVTCFPILYNEWNPATPDPEKIRTDPRLRRSHGVDFVPVVWIKNLAGGCDPDGRATFKGILDNAIHLDYSLSQLGRGINASASPQLMVKGKLLNYDRQGGSIVLGPQTMLQLPADRKQGEASLTGADAKFLEITGSGIEVGMSKFVERIKQWTQEIATVSRKDPNTISGAMSGKAMELIDSDFMNLVEVLKVSYGDEGELEIMKKSARMMIQIGEPDWKGVDEQALDDTELDSAKMYPATPDEVNQLSQALTTNIKGGLMSQEESRTYLSSQIDLRGQGFDPDAVPDLAELTAVTNPKPPEPTGGSASPGKPKAKAKAKPKAKAAA